MQIDEKYQEKCGTYTAWSLTALMFMPQYRFIKKNKKNIFEQFFINQFHSSVIGTFLGSSSNIR